MKKILITGENGFISNALKQWLNKYSDLFEVELISLRNNAWKAKCFSDYDAIIHVAGIAHIKENKSNEEVYYRINRSLTEELAKKAKSDKVKHFIFLSTMSVFGLTEGVINKETQPNPNNAYGKSKMEAEKSLSEMETPEFIVSIIRPPMIYGKNCKGNYQNLSKFSKHGFLFPKIENSRSMIYIDNFSEFVKLLLLKMKSGIFHPQNIEYVCTSELVKEIAIANNQKVYFTKVFNPLVKVLNLNVIKKIFGNLIYEKELTDEFESYNVVSFKESIKITEGVE